MNLDHPSTQAYPGKFFLTSEVPSVTAFLGGRGWLVPGERVETLDRAGEGNMNCVMRVRTSERTFILKQSRPWVEKYPGIAAPWDRTLVEAAFYRQVEQGMIRAPGMIRAAAKPQSRRASGGGAATKAVRTATKLGYGVTERYSAGY